MSFGASFIKDILKRFESYKSLGDKTLEQLSEEDLKYQPNDGSNSVAIIIQHLYGNMMSRFTNFLTEDGEKSWRKRDAEFEPMELSKHDIIDCWETGWSTVLHAIRSLNEEDLMKEITIRSEKLLVFDALLRQLGHYPYHVGQMIYIGKMLKGKEWKSLSIPKGESNAYNNSMMGK
jgi:hypothetical protein